MKISTKGRYALRMLIDLAEHQSEGYVALKDVAARQNVSKKYLEQIVPILNKQDILKTNRGFQGGYMLAQSPEHYTIGQILRLTEGSMSPVEYTAQDEGSAEFSLLPIWRELDKLINEYLDGITLQSILNQKQSQYANDYII